MSRPGSRHRCRAAFRGVLISLVLPLAAHAASPGFRPIELHARQIDTFLPSLPVQTFGPLEFRGGLDLTSPDRHFGGLSGLDFASDGTLFAISDNGLWFAARPVEKDGWLVGLEDARLAPILNNAGIPLSGKSWGDAEGFRIVKGGGHDTALVSFEGVNDLRAFDADDFVLASSRPVDLPKAVHGLSHNAGLEALAIAAKSGPLDGAAVLIAEQSLDRSGNHPGWIVGGPRAGAFSVKSVGDYGITDAAFLPDGDLLLLERALRFPFGFVMRIRRIAADDLVPGAIVDGEVIVEADLRYQIDNMEGLAVGTNEKGETIVALVSDNNDNTLQRTLLLYFALVE